ncbi:MAG: polysaccharide deacetylase family protein [Anaerolineae bacterium]|nr:polysaccharide deacetylase family protein [Anaerolineae bacterium]MDW8171380.1 polysaccharide deacetylase family protein [Anaerolineae bacterium]
MRTLILFCCAALLSLGASAQGQDEPTVIGDGTLRRLRVPILMYHYVGSLPPNADQYRTALTISASMFRDHLRYLAEEGYSTISLYDLDEALNAGYPLPPKPIILTFDDGYIDHYENVFPALQEFGFTGTFFIITGFADENKRGHLSWPQIIEMGQAGMSMEAHTKSHVELDKRSYDFLVYQMLGSIESLEAYLGRPARMFSYPVGRYDDLTLLVASQANIRRAVTTQNGQVHTTDNRLELPRLRISNMTGVAALAQMLQGR